MHIMIVVILTLILFIVPFMNQEHFSAEAATFVYDHVYGMIWDEETQQEVVQENLRTMDILDKYYRYPGYQCTAEYYFTTQLIFEMRGNLSLIYAKTDELISGLDGDREKATAIHDWISKNISFSHDTSYDGSDITHPCANPFTVWENRSAVCWGYSNLTDLMMQHAGINCVVVRGNVPQGTHVWNAALIDGVWYYLDNTWDANYYEQKGTLSYLYFLKDSEFFSKNHEVRVLESCGGDSFSWVVLTSRSSADKMVPVTFDPNGGSISIKKALLRKDSGANYIPVPVREGYTFDGWYTSVSGNDKITRSGDTNLYLYEPASETTIYAHWRDMTTGEVPGEDYHDHPGEEIGNTVTTPLIQRIIKSDNPLTVKAKKVTLKAKTLKKKKQMITRAKAIKVSGAQGRVTYKLTGVSRKKFKKHFKVNASNGNITVKKKLKRGKYILKIKITADGNSYYNTASKTVKVVVKVK